MLITENHNSYHDRCSIARNSMNVRTASATIGRNFFLLTRSLGLFHHDNKVFLFVPGRQSCCLWVPCMNIFLLRRRCWKKLSCGVDDADEEEEKDETTVAAAVVVGKFVNSNWLQLLLCPLSSQLSSPAQQLVIMEVQVSAGDDNDSPKVPGDI